MIVEPQKLMKKILMMNNIYYKTLLLLISITFLSCADENTPGYEFMPNMYRSPSIETYSEHTIDGYNGIPVKGTISRGNISTFNYGPDEYIIAGNESNYPSNFLRNEDDFEEGKELYGIMCSHCHGLKGDGKGSIKHPLYSSIPAYFDTIPNRRSGVSMSELTEGHIFHAITYGLNAMGPHASQINELERWQIVYYIKSELQKK